jgi:hypothetical protein
MLGPGLQLGPGKMSLQMDSSMPAPQEQLLTLSMISMPIAMLLERPDLRCFTTTAAGVGYTLDNTWHMTRRVRPPQIVLHTAQHWVPPCNCSPPAQHADPTASNTCIQYPRFLVDAPCRLPWLGRQQS